MPNRGGAGSSKVIRGGLIIKGGRAAEVFGLGDVWIEGSTIEAITLPGVREASDRHELISVEDGIVMPGLIDTHRHLWQTPLRGLGADLTAPEYRSRLRAAKRFASGTSTTGKARTMLLVA